MAAASRGTNAATHVAVLQPDDEVARRGAGLVLRELSNLIGEEEGDAPTR